jgi:hypothetical protein
VLLQLCPSGGIKSDGAWETMKAVKNSRQRTEAEYTTIIWPASSSLPLLLMDRPAVALRHVPLTRYIMESGLVTGLSLSMWHQVKKHGCDWDLVVRAKTKQLALQLDPV